MAACKNNTSMLHPPSITKRPRRRQGTSGQSIIKEWYSEFDNPNGAIAKIQELKAHLSFDMPHSVVEQALCDLARLLGANGSRPENTEGEGPDGLWLWQGFSLVIEVKNENKTSLHKKDGSQLLSSMQWFKENFPKRKNPIPVFVANVTLCDPGAYFPENTKVVTSDKMNILLERVEQFYGKMIAEPLLCSNDESLDGLLRSFSLLPEHFVKNFTDKLQKS